MNKKSNVNSVFIAVHAGAGNHSQSNEPLYKAVCKRACQQAMQLLKSKASAMEAVSAAVAVLEDDEITNAGIGSSLTSHGKVECDACIMDGKSHLFGAVGALSGVKNPVTVAQKLVEEQQLGPLSFGRIRPSILVGSGAQLFCTEKGFDVNENLISENSFKTYNRYKRKCQKAEMSAMNNPKRQKVDKEDKDSESIEVSELSNTCNHEDVQDTVGAVCVDHEGNVASAASSGGIWLKHPGRLGPAAVYGSGCWAQNQISQDKPGIAAVTSGCGEDVIQTVLAKTCCDGIRSCEGSDAIESLGSVFKDSFLGSEILSSKQEKFGGALVLRVIDYESEREVEMYSIHSTASMCLASMSGTDKTCTHTVMSRLDNSSIPGQSYAVGGHLHLTDL